MYRATTMTRCRGAALMTFAVWTLTPLYTAEAQHIENKFVSYSDALQAKAEAGDAGSQVALAVAYLQGNGTPRRYNQAAALLQKASAQGNRDAAGWLGGLYLSGQGVIPDITKGAELIEQSRAEGSAVGLRYTALRAEKGIGRPVDGRLAIKLYELAAGHSDPIACDRMGLVYQSGRLRKQDVTKASNFFECGASAGYSWAQLHLGELYASDLPFEDFQHKRAKGVEPWSTEAYEMYSKAAATGNRVASFRTAESLRDGRGVPLDLKAAEAHFLQATRQGYGPAQEALGDLYQQHPELGRKREIAFVLYKEAAAQGEPGADAKAALVEKQMSATELGNATKRLEAAKQTLQRYRESVPGFPAPPAAQ